MRAFVVFRTTDFVAVCLLGQETNTYEHTVVCRLHARLSTRSKHHINSAAGVNHVRTSASIIQQ